MRMQLVLLAISSLIPPYSHAVDVPSACDLLPGSIVSSIVGTEVRSDTLHSDGKERRSNTCGYSGKSVNLTFSILPNETEEAARTRLARALERTFPKGASLQPLRGIGTEARFGAVDGKARAAIVGRYDTTVFMLSGPNDQAMLVALTRRALAQLNREPHQDHL
ncbi:hypothetical protein [Steroidobacter sp.]|uniref:hypothetical protein n=1 Tax=Steroidobacter sp. TaxID=1978227 RepID=UPI001A5777A6|nr:hypothetical protein [Steroidobacter sp.]MBL8269769.1 hypothetical protein [Steroidobacter sp.]